MRRSVAAVLLVGHLTVGVAAAQTVSATMGAIDGRVTDNTTGVLPGVTVTISGPAMMGTRVATTNDQGAYRIAAVPPGDYIVVFELDRKSTRLNSSHLVISYAVFCLKKKIIQNNNRT